ncbi:SdrD B-like domain-containing protein [Roseovarius aestuariivivens]|uniref:SdrD B-like domain-containing protein n=1 Tax=Roseovarius aestuariivivens TaxID=1888910 RepID=UPI001080EE50|nr:SdrD B-like domain-containing protein [Roseovarius aestuariivivens]
MEDAKAFEALIFSNNNISRNPQLATFAIAYLAEIEKGYFPDTETTQSLLEVLSSLGTEDQILEAVLKDIVSLVAPDIGGRVWFDVDRDGLQDPDEVGLSGVAVTLTGSGADGILGTSDDTTQTVVTDESGDYLFADLDPDREYRTAFTLPFGYEFTLRDQGLDDNIDSEVDPTTGLSSVIVLNSDADELSVDAGLILANRPPDISVEIGDTANAFIFEDADGLATTGSLTVIDEDQTNAVYLKLISLDISGYTGPRPMTDDALFSMLTLDPMGTQLNADGVLIDSSETVDQITWQFYSAGESFDFLGLGETLRLDYVVYAIDDSGIPPDSDEQIVTVDISGKNSAPVISFDYGEETDAVATVTVDKVTASGSLMVADSDITDTVNISVSGVSTPAASGVPDAGVFKSYLSLLPTMVLGPTETYASVDWKFSADADAFDFLKDGQSLTISYEITARDDSGAPNDSDANVIHVTVTKPSSELSWYARFDSGEGTASAVPGTSDIIVGGQAGWVGLDAFDLAALNSTLIGSTSDGAGGAGKVRLDRLELNLAEIGLASGALGEALLAGTHFDGVELVGISTAPDKAVVEAAVVLDFALVSESHYGGTAEGRDQGIVVDYGAISIATGNGPEMSWSRIENLPEGPGTGSLLGAEVTGAVAVGQGGGTSFGESPTGSDLSYMLRLGKGEFIELSGFDIVLENSTNVGSSTGGGGDAGKVKTSQIDVTLDSTNPDLSGLLRDLVVGTHFDTMEIEVWQADGARANGTLLAEHLFDQVLVSEARLDETRDALVFETGSIGATYLDDTAKTDFGWNRILNTVEAPPPPTPDWDGSVAKPSSELSWYARFDSGEGTASAVPGTSDIIVGGQAGWVGLDAFDLAALNSTLIGSTSDGAGGAGKVRLDRLELNLAEIGLASGALGEALLAGTHFDGVELVGISTAPDKAVVEAAVVLDFALVSESHYGGTAEGRDQGIVVDYGAISIATGNGPEMSWSRIENLPEGPGTGSLLGAEVTGAVAVGQGGGTSFGESPTGSDLSYMLRLGKGEFIELSGFDIVLENSTNVGSSTGGGGDAGKVKTSQIDVTLDSTNPDLSGLLRDLVVGTHFDTMEIEVWQADGARANGTLLAEHLFDQVLVSEARLDETRDALVFETGSIGATYLDDTAKTDFGWNRILNTVEAPPPPTPDWDGII